MSLKIAAGLSLPLDVVTQTMAILAKRRAGKSYTMRRLVEQLFNAHQQVVVVDPKGDQWGLRSKADGKTPGLPIVILGGERGDVPLEPSSGEIIAKLVVEERISALLDLSLFRKHEVSTFMTTFLENLYRLKAREIYRTPMMLVIDEADAIAPQKPQKGEERMLGAAEDIVRRGGQRGIGCVLVTQRSAVLNKNVLTQAQILVVLRTIAPQDLKAMKAWIDVHGDEEQGKTLMESLPSLPTGDAWFWSPGWPTTDGIFKRVHVLPIDTFDSGASPTPGAKPVEPKNLADIDLDALKDHMAATIEKAQANDPKLLRAEIARLKAEAVKKPAQPGTSSAEAMRDAEAKGYNLAREESLNWLAGVLTDVQIKAEAVAKASAALLQGIEHVKQTRQTSYGAKPPKARLVPQVYVKRPTLGVQASPGNGSLPKAERLILTALAQYPDGRRKEQVAILTGYSVNGGAFNNSLGALRSKAWITRGEPIQITETGLRELGAYDPLPHGQALLDHWMGNLGKAERLILKAAAEAYPGTLNKQQIAVAAGYEANGGAFNNALGRLRSLELIRGRGEIKASEDLFE